MNFPSSERQKTEQPVSLKRPSQDEIPKLKFNKSLVRKNCYFVMAYHRGSTDITPLGYVKRGWFSLKFEPIEYLMHKVSVDADEVIYRAKANGIRPILK